MNEEDYCPICRCWHEAGTTNYCEEEVAERQADEDLETRGARPKGGG